MKKWISENGQEFMAEKEVIGKCHDCGKRRQVIPCGSDGEERCRECTEARAKTRCYNR